MRSTTLAAPLMLECQRAILAREGWPLLRAELPGATAAFHRQALDRHLDTFPEVAFAEAKKAHAQLGIQAPENTRALNGIDPERLARAARARKPLREQTLRKRWCSTLWPTQAGAQQAGMNLADFEAFVARALFLDQPDPARSWGELRSFQAALIDRLKGARELHIEAPGTDLTLNVKGRTWVNSDGKRNMPSGEVFTGPHETSANGRIRFGVPSSPAGVDVAGVDLEFRDGARRRGGRRARRRVPPARAGDRRGRAPSRRDRDRHELRHRSCDRRDAVRREDRRHRASRARPLVSRDGREERLSPALGPDLRSARGRPPDGRRSDHRAGRSLCVVGDPGASTIACERGSSSSARC